MPVCHGQTPARRLRPAGKRTALASRTRLRRPPLICRRRGDEAHFNPGGRFLIRASSRRLLRHGAGASCAVLLKIPAPGLAGQSADCPQFAARRQADKPRNYPSRLSLFHPLRVGTTRAPLKKVSRPPISRLSKAPEGWRSPRRFARFGGRRSTRQRLGLRWPSTAFSWRTQIFKRRSSNPNRFWQRYWPRSWRTAIGCAGPLVLTHG